jgi:Calcineurin-like phosphoesterase
VGIHPRVIALAGCGLLVVVGCSSVDPASSPPSAEPRTSTPPSAPTQAPAKPVSLVAVGDIACDPTSPVFSGQPEFCEQARVAARVGKLVDQGADWFVPLGDIQYESGSLQAFREVYDTEFGQFKKFTQPIPGNHEYNTEGASGYFDYFGARAGSPEQPWRTFEPVEGWQVLLLDSNCEYNGGCGPDSRQGKWIQRTLKASTADCVVAAWHHPLQTSGEYAGNADSAGRAQQLWSLVDAGGADLVLNGHDHIYERFQKLDGVQQFTVGTGGKNPYEITTKAPGSVTAIDDTYGVLLLTMRPDGHYNFAFVAADGSVLDKGSNVCTNEPKR